MKPIDIQTMGMIGMIGIDYTDSNYIVSIELVNRNPVSEQENYEYFQGKGKTLTSALEAAEIRSGTIFFWGSLRVVAIGIGAAVNNIQDIVYTLGSNTEIRPKTLVTVVEPTAEKLVMGEEKKGGVMYNRVESWIIEGIEKQIVPHSDIISLMRSSQEKNAGGLASYIEVGTDEKTVDDYGSAIIYQKKLVAILDRDVTSTIMWLNNTPKHLTTEIVSEKLGTITGVIKNSKVKLRPIVSGTKLSFVVELKLDASIESVIGDNRSGMSFDNVEDVEEMFRQVITQRVERTLDITISQCKKDIIGLNKNLRKYKPQYYETYNQNWEQTLAEIDFIVNVTVEIDTIGKQLDNKIPA